MGDSITVDNVSDTVLFYRLSPAMNLILSDLRTLSLFCYSEDILFFIGLEELRAMSLIF